MSVCKKGQVDKVTVLLVGLLVVVSFAILFLVVKKLAFGPSVPETCQYSTTLIVSRAWVNSSDGIGKNKTITLDVYRASGDEELNFIYFLFKDGAGAQYKSKEYGVEDIPFKNQIKSYTVNVLDLIPSSLESFADIKIVELMYSCGKASSAGISFVADTFAPVVSANYSNVSLPAPVLNTPSKSGGGGGGGSSSSSSGSGECTNDAGCEAAGSYCSSLDAYYTCSNTDTDSCLEKSGDIACGINEQCIEGVCTFCSDDDGDGFDVCGGYYSSGDY
ncbi:MAG: hypothetical protein ACP5OG_02465, partial [Candidatus Nanoarchaeia archaeon]